MPEQTITDEKTSRAAAVRPRSVILFWLPLAATWLMMAVELPYIAAIVARMPDAAHNLAAFGVSTALAWLIESPIMMLLSASTALVHGRASYLALRRFATILNVGVTLGMMILAIPPVFRFVGQRLMGLPPEIASLANLSTAILVFWPAAIGYRRFYQGILVRHHLTRRVGYGTIVRLTSMSITAAALAVTTSLRGATIGAIALLAGVMAEALASRMMAREIVVQLMANEDVVPGSLLTFTDIARFYYPLALTSILSMALGPLVTFGLGRGRAPIESLAVWPVVNAVAFLFRSGGVAFQEVGVALAGQARENHRTVSRTALSIGVAATAAMTLFAFTPLQAVWFEQLSGLSSALAAFAIVPARILVLLPLTEYLLSIQRARWILEHRTGVITVATAVECGGLAVALFAGVGMMNVTGAVAGAIAVMAGRIAANGFLQGMASRKRELT